MFMQCRAFGSIDLPVPFRASLLVTDFEPVPNESREPPAKIPNDRERSLWECLQAHLIGSRAGIYFYKSFMGKEWRG